MKLVTPGLEYKVMFLQFIQDLEQNDPERAWIYAGASKDFSIYLQQLMDSQAGRNLKPGYVPCSHFWLIDNGQMLGAIRVRHNIDNEFLRQECGHIGYDIAPTFRGCGHGTTILKLGLQKAERLGITQVLVTADEDNTASRKVIEKNQGRFESTIMGDESKVRISRYWFNLG
ncbi:GNAT family N-acetyltransferase [Endozoicomonadaceae bacterium StTr2]